MHIHFGSRVICILLLLCCGGSNCCDKSQLLDMLYLERMHEIPSVNAQNHQEARTDKNNNSQSRDRTANHVMSRVYNDVTTMVSSEDQSRHIKPSAQNPIKVLLMSKSRRFPGDARYVEEVCGISYCQFTTDRSQFNESDAILYHAFHQGSETDGYGNHYLPVHQHRSKNQKFIFMTKEAPYYTSIYFNHGLPMKDTFNLTMTYHANSDVPMPYGYTTLLTEEEKLQKRRLLEDTKFAENRTKQVLWLTSHPNAPSGRDDYVTELKRHIKVDIFGKTVKRPIEKGLPTEKLYNSYKFFIAFENALCSEYITEKVWNPLKMGLIPIVLGGGDYDNLLPPRSFINVVDFQSPRHLADYLRLLDRNETLYNQYFDWRMHYEVIQNRGSWYPVCDLCQVLYRSRDKVSTRDITDLYTYSTACETKESFLHNISLPLSRIDYFSREITAKWIGT